MMRRLALHRAVFRAAGFYNLVFGIYTVLDPQWLFRFAGMAPTNYPEVFACLAMVIGLYGLLYFEVARRPEQGYAIAAVGLAGKVLGPIGMAYLVVRGLWPWRGAALCLTNDLVWWVPFALYLRDARALRPARA
jgi:hypothetical protein